MTRRIVFFFQAEDGIRDKLVTGVQTCALPISERRPTVDRGKRRPAAHAVAARWILHLDDVGAEIGEQRAREGPRRDLSEFKDADPRQRSVALAVARSAHASAPARNAAQRITALPMRAAPIPRLAPSPALARAADRRRSCGHVAEPGRA